MKKKLLSLLMACVLVFGMSTTVFAAEVTESVVPASEITLEWIYDEEGNCTYEVDWQGQVGLYFIYRDGVRVGVNTTNSYMHKYAGKVNQDFTESGSYKVELYNMQGTTLIGSTEEITYVRPANVLPAPGAATINADGSVTFPAVAGPVEFYGIKYIKYNPQTGEKVAELYGGAMGALVTVDNGDGTLTATRTSQEPVVEGLNSNVVDFLKLYSKECDVAVQICAYSADVENVANSDFGPVSNKYYCNSVSSSTENTIVSTTDSTVSVTDSSNVLPVGTTMYTEKVASGATYEAAVAAVASKVESKEKVAVYEINLEAAGVELHQLAGKVKVTVDVPFAISEGKTIKVYRLEGTELIPCNTTVANGKVTFETDHFSTYVFVEEFVDNGSIYYIAQANGVNPYASGAADATVAAVTSPKTGDTNVALIVAMFALATAGVVVVRRRVAK